MVLERIVSELQNFFKEFDCNKNIAWRSKWDDYTKWWPAISSLISYQKNYYTWKTTVQNTNWILVLQVACHVRSMSTCVRNRWHAMYGIWYWRVKGKIIFKTYSPKEWMKWGIRLFVLADSDTGFVHSRSSYYRKLTGDTCNFPYSEKPFTSRIVLSLMVGL
jgi:hypothetical protein